MFSTLGMSKARQEVLYKVAKQRVSRPRLGRFWKRTVRFVDNAGNQLIERRQDRLDVLHAEMKG